MELSVAGGKAGPAPLALTSRLIAQPLAWMPFAILHGLDAPCSDWLPWWLTGWLPASLLAFLAG